MFTIKDHKILIRQRGNELLQIEPWGTNALRVRATQYPHFTKEDFALTEEVKKDGQVHISEGKAVITNGKIRAEVTDFGEITFWKEDQIILREYYRSFGASNPHSPSMKVFAREFTPIYGGDYQITVRFDNNDQEMLFGMGQYQQPNLNLKGCILELAQRNSQVSIPFALSSLGYGFLWNNPAVGTAAFGTNYTQWQAKVADQLDYWITADDTPRHILTNFTEVTGRSPKMPEDVMGLWQCKLRYRTQEEVLQVAREYHRRGIPLDVIVIDFFHWIRQGDWSFDPKYWPDPKAMVEELKQMGTRCMVSVWPTVDRGSVHHGEMNDRGLLVRTERGSSQTFDFLGDTRIYDATNPEARDFIWNAVKKNYYDHGIDLFWLDCAEPEYIVYDFDHYRYYLGPDVKIGNLYPLLHVKAFEDGMKKEGREDSIHLIRSAWVGSQKYSALVWSGDIKSNFASLRDQFAAGLNIGIAGIPWWVTDTGGFFGDVTAEGFDELLIRWFEYSTFSPILRLHGDRGPHDIPNLEENTIGGGFCATGRPNELWSYGEKVYEILQKYVTIRLQMKPYITKVMEDAHLTGSPVIRTMFYEFPEDKTCWELNDQYMFGPDYLVAPILYQGMTSRQVYLPKGQWIRMNTSEVLEGEQIITVDAPLDEIPVFIRN
ncbi:MAG: alpha-glucosidase, family 31 of glycosyl hydrolase [Herbinix sp.]|jgi:alpha-D-xyloside xylohydrolase|nr:alpha-glucosidase, family 31 of glycosyl hydrolase [Herbinix sp.]